MVPWYHGTRCTMVYVYYVRTYHGTVGTRVPWYVYSSTNWYQYGTYFNTMLWYTCTVLEYVHVYVLEYVHVVV
jgi:hypothetical protein